MKIMKIDEVLKHLNLITLLFADFESAISYKSRPNHIKLKAPIYAPNSVALINLGA